MRKILFSIFIFFFLSGSVYAVTSVNERPNNKFGIHLAVPSDEDLEAAAKLVNSEGGEWGYVTLVIQDNDLNIDKWQEIFNKLRRFKLIPIIRLATHPEGEVWARATEADVDKWRLFLNSLNWVVKNRYVILFNETNHGSEWGGEADPQNYARVALAFAQTLKKSSPDYFLMLAGFDQATPQAPPNYLSATYYLGAVMDTLGKDDFEKYFDGLSSHSYPNPGFSGTPTDLGLGTVRGYESELNFLEGKGTTKTLPVFITETGWKRGGLSEETVADYLRQAFENVWLGDSRVVAVTPFVLNYQSDPFLDFSWRKLNDNSFYPQFETVRRMGKLKGEPQQVEQGNFLRQMPKELVQDSSFKFRLEVENTGQGIWETKDNYEFKLVSRDNYFYHFSPLVQIEPQEIAELDFEFHTPKKLGQSQLKVGLFKNEEPLFLSGNWPIKIIPLANITLKYRLLGFRNSGNDFQAEIYDENQNLVHVSRHLTGNKGIITLKKVRNVAVGEKYRVVLLKPYYLPRQTYITLAKKNNEAKFGVHLPLDWNGDGAWSAKDWLAIFERK